MLSLESILAGILLLSSPESLPEPQEVIQVDVLETIIQEKLCFNVAYDFSTTSYMDSLIDVLKADLITFSIDQQVIDDSAKEYTISKYTPIDSVRTLQEKFKNLAGFPLIEELNRFPDREQINKCLEINRKVHTYFVERLAIDLYHADELKVAISECDQLYHIWMTLRDAGYEFYFVNQKRESLASLRTLIGEEAFYSGQMPPHIPIWHFRKN